VEDIPQIRRAASSDAAALAELYVGARRAAVPSIPPSVHSEDEIRRWFADVVVPEREVWLAATGSDAVVGLMVLLDELIDQLYVDPSRLGQGIGTSLVELAQERRPDGLALWTFESNRRAHRFYERHGFVVAERTDGADNEEHAPDRRYVWRPS